MEIGKSKIAAVIVTYNRCELLLNCVQCILSQRGARCDVLIVDNNSSDGTGDAVASMGDERIYYRSTGANLGGAGGFNFGMRWAVEAGYDHVWIMDDDCLPMEDALARLIEADSLLNGEYGFISSVVLWKDGKECKMNRQKIRKAYYEHVDLLEHGIIQVEQATFVSLFFPVSVIHDVGLPIKEFFIWGDDIEYTRRIAVRYSIPCYMAGRSRVIHAMKDNNGSSIALDAPERIDRYRFAFRNEAYLYRKEGFKGVSYYLAKCGLNLFRIITSGCPCKLKRIHVLISSMIKGLFFRPDIEKV